MSDSPATWRDLLGAGHRGAVSVLAGGLLVGAVNIYLTASLLPTAVADLGGASFYAWNLTLYLVAMVVTTMLVSRFLARWGNVGAYLIGFGVFAAGSLVCAVGPSMPVLLAGRVVQGLGAGLLSGLAYAVIRSALPPRLWTRGAALMSGMYGIGNLVGPALGGLFAQFGQWRPAFLLMAGAAAVGGVLVPRVLPRGERGGARAPIPVVSLALVTAATTAVSVVSVLPGAAAMGVGIVVAVALIAGFVVYERRSDLRVFPRATYRADSPLKWVYLTIGLLSFGVAVESFLPLFGQESAGLPPFVAGLFAAAVSLGWSATQIFSASAVAERAVRRLCVLGPVLLAGGFLALALMQREDPPVWLVAAWVPALLIAGAGIGLAYPHLSVAAMSATADPEEGRASAAGIATVTSLSTAFGTAVAGVLVNLGGASMVDSARIMLIGFTVVCALGILTSRGTRRARAGAPEAADAVTAR
ncbi:MFS transporter [Sinosporangium siamense]|uniref:MFS transporter n=1 Tax=Sinosporangium siamense TaxID=1367973 RepID=A0A919RKW7_9ACTN|nr:MFS transporter [Sinosporangium siamense]GII93956.1 MFS transporter [Sinosporangium siamense]